MDHFNFSNETISESIYRHIVEQISNRVYKQSDKLPSENELCELYNVSRVSVRSALQKLRAHGFVYTKPGKGTYVLSNNIDTVMMANRTRFLDMTKKEYFEVIELRQTIEYKSLELMVKRGTKEDFDNLKNALEDMKASVSDYSKYSDADIKFHLAIIKGSHNRLFYEIINSCHNALIKYFIEMNKVNFDSFKDSIEKHSKIYIALTKGNYKVAQKILLDMINYNIENNLAYLRD